jgi:hypothetical protein
VVQHDCGPFSEEWIAEKLTEELKKRLDDWEDVELRSPEESGLDRFTIRARKWGEEDQYFCDRVYSENELRELLPQEIYDAVIALEGVEL